MCGFKEPNYGVKMRHQEQRRQKAIQAGTGVINKAFTQYDEPFYADYRNKFMKYSMPQLAQQYRDASAGLGFGLSNRGLRTSSAGAMQRARLNRGVLTGQQSLVDQSIEGAAKLRNQIEGMRSNALSQLYQSQDPASTAQSAFATASQFTPPSTFAPIINSIGDIASYYTMNQMFNQLRNPTLYVPPNAVASSYLAPLPKNVGGNR